MTASWSPLLSDPPAIAGVLLSGLRQLVPSLFEAARQAPQRPTKRIAVALAVEDDPSASLSVIGRDLYRAEHGARDALFLDFHGEARLRSGALPVAGAVVLDLATGGILQLRLTQPLAL